MTFTFDATAFREAWSEVRPLVLAEWPAIDAAALDATSGDPTAVVELVSEATEHTKALTARQLGELAEIAGVGASGLERRLIRLVRKLEQEGEQLAGQAQEAKHRAEGLFREAEQQGREVADKVRERVPEAEVLIKDNLWTTLLAALGFGVLMGLFVGLSRGR